MSFAQQKLIGKRIYEHCPFLNDPALMVDLMEAQWFQDEKLRKSLKSLLIFFGYISFSVFKSWEQSRQIFGGDTYVHREV